MVIMSGYTLNSKIIIKHMHLMSITLIHIEWDSFSSQQTQWIGRLHYVYGEY